MSHKELISTTEASSEVSTDVLVTVQEGGEWLEAEFMGTANELLRQLFDPSHWLNLENKGTGNKTNLTIVEGLKIGKGMSGLVTVHCVKMELDNAEDAEPIVYDSHFRGLLNFKAKRPYDESR